jgi:hypothetical protein
MTHLPLVMAMVATAQFSQKVDTGGSANDRFNHRSTNCSVNNAKLFLQQTGRHETLTVGLTPSLHRTLLPFALFLFLISAP